MGFGRGGSEHSEPDLMRLKDKTMPCAHGVCSGPHGRERRLDSAIRSQRAPERREVTTRYTDTR